jgi:UDP-N-acetyl-alpha-D-muramoyl-L-alanyl-L-glutamate epimerase
MIVGGSELFEFSGFAVDEKSRTIRLTYACGKHIFNEVITLPKDAILANLADPAGQHALKLLHLISGVSYYKAFVRDVKRFVVPYYIPEEVKNYVKLVYEKGLGELLYTHKLSPRLNVYVQTKMDVEDIGASDLGLEGYSLGLGGGKDSLVAVEILKRIGEPKISTFGVNAHEVLSAQAALLETTHSSIRRQVDLQALKNLKENGNNGIVLNGHVPISAILVHIGLVNALAHNMSTVVVAVERSANEPTVKNYLGVEVNHQWSKSSEFEKALDSLLKSYVHRSAGFMSIVRPLRELEIMKLYFAMRLAEKFKTVSSSCNRSLAFTTSRTEDSPLWCGECEKCAFMYLLMHGAGQPEFAQEIMRRDLFADTKLYFTYRGLLGLSDTKPFDCVGDIAECRESMTTAKRTMASAEQFKYDDPLPSTLWDEQYQLPPSINDKIKALCEELLSVRH